MKRLCYVHVGPHKTGTSSIQAFLRDNRAALLQQGYFVPDSGEVYGAHHWLARKLCGEDVQPHQRSIVGDFAKALSETPSEAVVISSEDLDGLLKDPRCATLFFEGLAALELEPCLVLFPRHQPKWLNSRYSQLTKAFLRDEPFRHFIRGCINRFDVKYVHWIELADKYGAKLISSPFTAHTMANGVIGEFLKVIGLNRDDFQITDLRHNEAVGPFTVSVARRVLRKIGGVERLKRLQAVRLKSRLSKYLAEEGLEDGGYVGLTTALAKEIEEACVQDNDIFAKRLWNASWSDVFVADIGKEYLTNDFALIEPPREVKRRMRDAIEEMLYEAKFILQKPELAIDAPWNDIRRTFD